MLFNTYSPISSHQSAINGITRPSRVRTLIAQKKCNQLSHLLRLTSSFEAESLTIKGSLLGRRPGYERLYHGRIDRARRNAVDPDIPVAFLFRGAPRQANHAMLSRSSVQLDSKAPRISPTLLVEYGAPLFIPCKPATLDALTILASLSILCNSALMQMNTPLRLTSMTESQSSSVRSLIAFSPAFPITPARFAAPCSPPSSLTVSSSQAPTSSALATLTAL